MDSTTYTLRKIGGNLAHGVTHAAYATLNAILKFDCDESPNNVYNEIVATKLAQTLHIPVADGVLVSTGDGQAYASLSVTSPGIPLPDLNEGRVRRCAESYPEAVAALVAFDLWIGNYDRGRNIKVSLTTPYVRVFRGFDHGHALLNTESTVPDSVASLGSDALIVRQHPFFGYVKRDLLTDWFTRIAQLPAIYVHECCEFGRPFRGVSEDVQRLTANALLARRDHLPSIATTWQATIRMRP